MNSKKLIEELVPVVAKNFRTFGGGKGSSFNPLAEALKDKAPQFAAGVDVKEVVAFIVNEILLDHKLTEKSKHHHS